MVNNTERKSGVTGSRVCGLSSGVGGVGLSALMLYQYLGRSDSLSKKRVCSDIFTSILCKDLKQ
jgi:hypothetical protein